MMKRLQILFLSLFLFFLDPAAFPQPGIGTKQKGVTYLRNNQFIEALEQFNLAIAQQPYLPDLYFLRGYAKYNLDDYLGAERDYSRAIELAPFHAEVFINRAVVRSQQLNYAGAFEDFNQALQLDSANSDIFLNRARTNLILKKYYSCITDCNRAIHLKTTQEMVYILKGTAEMGIKRYEEAIADLSKAVQMNKDNLYSYTQRGLVWMELEKPDSAIADFNLALKIDSNNTYTLFNRSMALMKIKDQAGALADLDKVIGLSPYNSYAYYNRAILRIGMDDKKGAIRDFEYVSKLNPQNIFSYYYRSMLKADLKDYTGALADLDKTIELFPGNPDVWYERSLVRSKLHDRAGAKEDYDHAVSLGNKNKFSPDSLSYIRENYLESLVKLSGNFEEMNTRNSKFQNQYVKIELLPMFDIYPAKGEYSKTNLYDAYKRGNYYMNVISLTSHPEIMTDSLTADIIRSQTRLIDSLGPAPLSCYRRGVCLAARKEYTRAFNDFGTALGIDSSFVLAYFVRGNTRYQYIRYLLAQEDLQNPVTIGPRNTRPEEKAKGPEPDQTYDLVIRDYDRALSLDTGFYFVHYNRGYVNCKMGNYREAIRDFTLAIADNSSFAEAYFNRGLIYILQNERQMGCEDLSRAGELGILDSYKILKRYCNE
jgi:tetratricopeptide (TPR) repeat protein